VNFTKRFATLLAATALLAGGTLMVGAGTASASTITFEGDRVTGGDYQIIVLRDGKNIGYAFWNADPDAALDWPGDAMLASDIDSDGWGIQAQLSTGRLATTRGHAAPYTSPWATGNLTEGKTYYMSVCLVQGDDAKCSGDYAVVA
jgi:hypothetical protein